MATKNVDVKTGDFFLRSKRKRLLFFALWKYPLTRKEINDLNIELFATSKKVRKPRELKEELRKMEKMLTDEELRKGERLLTLKDKKRRKTIKERLRHFKDTGMVKVLPQLIRQGWIEKKGDEYRATVKYDIDVIREKYRRIEGGLKELTAGVDPTSEFDIKLKLNWITEEDIDRFERFLPKVFKPPECTIPPESRVPFLLRALEGAGEWEPFDAFLEEMERFYVLAVRDGKLHGSEELAKEMLSFLPVIVFARGHNSALKHFLFLTPEGN